MSCCKCCSCEETSPSSKYYWRDFTGTIPPDAVPADSTNCCNPRYIGLGYFKGYEYLPATILPQQGVARSSAYSNVLTSSQHVKILCSRNPDEVFEWISIESKDLSRFMNRYLIPGGSEVGESLYIGRVFQDGNVIIGKIFQDHRSNKGIWFPSEDGQINNSLSYDVLAIRGCDDKVWDIDPR